MASSELSTRKKLVFSSLVLFLFLFLAEVGVRGWVYYLREEYTRYDATTGMPYLVPGVHTLHDDPVVINQDGFVGDELLEHSPDLFRIVALGDSNTFGHGSRFYSYAAVLGQLMRERDEPGRRFEVINAGIEGMDSREALFRLREKVVELNPKIVVVYIGWNDLMKYDPFGQAGAGSLSAASRFMDRLWLVKGIRKLMFIYIRPRLDPPLTGPSSWTGQFKDFRPRTYIKNVRTIVREIRETGAKPILMNLTTVVRGHDSPEDLVAAGVFFPYYPSAYAVGDLLTLINAHNRAIDEISELDSVPVVDLHEIFVARPDYRELFIDTMHPTREGYAIIARNILAVIDEEGMIGDARSGD